MNILLSNDDGFDSPGILKLFHRLKGLGFDVTVVAPSRERSTAGHSLTLHKPLRIREEQPGVFSVSGSPADSVYLATRHILKKKPDIVISGINRGANLGNDIFYSGTVAAAREAFLYGLPALAVSLCYAFPNRKVDLQHWDTAVEFVVKFLETCKSVPSLLEHRLLNANVPNLPKSEVKGVQWARQGRRVYSDEIFENKDPRGKLYYWLGSGPVGFDKTPNSDCVVVADGYIALTPLNVDTTDDKSKKMLEAQAAIAWV